MVFQEGGWIMVEPNKMPRVVLGTMTLGQSVDRTMADRMLGLFLEAGHCELDTAFAYCEGRTEALLGEILTPERRRVVTLATKANPWNGKKLTADSVTAQLEQSLVRMKIRTQKPAPNSPTIAPVLKKQPARQRFQRRRILVRWTLIT